MRKTTRRFAVPSFLVVLTASFAALADHNWQESDVEGLLQTVNVSASDHPLIADKVLVGFKTSRTPRWSINFASNTSLGRPKCAAR